MVAVGERSGWWAGFRAECLDWRLVGSWVDGWVKGWQSRAVGFGRSGPKLERAIPTEENAGLAQVIIAKQRNGPVGEVTLRFFREYMRFENFTRRAEPMQ